MSGIFFYFSYSNALRLDLFRSPGGKLMDIPKFLSVRPAITGSILLSFLFLVLPFQAIAGLGDNAASVLSDRARLKGVLRSTDAHGYVMHEITAPTGSVVREFVSPAGAIFGVAWEGASPPNLEQLLGPYYDQAKQAAAQKARQGRAPIVIEAPSLVFYQTGHMRNFHGRAYIPQLVPPSVKASDIR